MSDQDERPVWADPEHYPAKPEESAFGAVSRKGHRSGFDTFEVLEAHVRGSRESVEAVWTPETERMVPPEAVPGLLEALRRRFIDLAEADRSDARRNTIIFGLLLGWAVYASAANKFLPQDSPTVGLAALLLLILGLIPWYDAWKSGRGAWELDAGKLETEEDDARFDHWLAAQRAVLTLVMLVGLAVAGAIQIWVGLGDSVDAAGLVKPRYAAGEWWRLFTAPFLHGHPLHWLLNAGALWYLGRRVEALAGWPHLALVFTGAMLAGGIASAALVALPSLGASGGILGLLGLLLVFETLHSRLVPHPSRRRLAAAVVFTFVAGIVASQFVDNYAHAGGLAAGMLYAAIVFPRSKSARRPRPTRLDAAVGAGAVLALAASLLLAVGLMLAS